jgi:hypothetical protein
LTAVNLADIKSRDLNRGKKGTEGEKTRGRKESSCGGSKGCRKNVKEEDAYL